MKILKVTTVILAILCFIGAIIPIVYGEARIGVPILIFMGIALLIFPYLLEQGGKVKKAAEIIYSIAFGIFFLLSSIMVFQAYGQKPPSTGKQTVIVLGAAIVRDCPSLVLGRRLRVAAAYLHQNPQATCIVSGGQGADEDYPEAEVMTNYLVAQGISRTRIIEEGESVNTRENLRFSKKLLPKDSTGVVIVTDNFHQARAAITARTVGLIPLYSLSSMPPIELLPQYWLRDMPGIPLTWFEERVLKLEEALITRDTLGGGA